MNQEDKFLTAKYTEYRHAFSKVERFTSLMLFDWFESPQTIRIDGEFGLQQMAYGDLASEAARDLASVEFPVRRVMETRLSVALRAGLLVAPAPHLRDFSLRTSIPDARRMPIIKLSRDFPELECGRVLR